MTFEYGGLWPAGLESSLGQAPAVLKWTHSIIQEPTFKTEWQAREDARGLAMEIADGNLKSSLSQFPLTVSHTTKTGKSKSVSFADDLVEIFDIQDISLEEVPGLTFTSLTPTIRHSFLILLLHKQAHNPAQALPDPRSWTDLIGNKEFGKCYKKKEFLMKRTKGQSST